MTDKLDEYQGHGDIEVIMLVEPDVISVKVYRRDAQGLWSVEKHNDLGQVVDLSEVKKLGLACTRCRVRTGSKS